MVQEWIYKPMVKDEILPKLKKIYNIEKKIKLQESVIVTTIKYSHDGSISND